MSDHLPPVHTEHLPSGLSFEMILVEDGSFEMGGSDPEARDNEKPIHKVEVPAFYIGKYLVTQKVWKEMMGNNPSRFKGDNRPVETVSWEEAQEFIQKLNQETGKSYRLPSEAEWEFAARGGIHSEGYLYSGSDKLKEVGWYRENNGRETRPVGQKMANELGIYDMSGNVFEWCEDDYHISYQRAPADGSAWIDHKERGSRRVVRGGYWLDNARNCRVSYRYYSEPDYREQRHWVSVGVVSQFRESQAYP